MKLYEIYVNEELYRIKASRAAVAIHRAVDRYGKAEEPLTIRLTGVFKLNNKGEQVNEDFDPMRHFVAQLRTILPEKLDTSAATDEDIVTDSDSDPMRHFIGQLRVILAELYAAKKRQ